MRSLAILPKRLGPSPTLLAGRPTTRWLGTASQSACERRRRKYLRNLRAKRAHYATFQPAGRPLVANLRSALFCLRPSESRYQVSIGRGERIFSRPPAAYLLLRSCSLARSLAGQLRAPPGEPPEASRQHGAQLAALLEPDWPAPSSSLNCESGKCKGPSEKTATLSPKWINSSFCLLSRPLGAPAAE